MLWFVYFWDKLHLELNADMNIERVCSPTDVLQYLNSSSLVKESFGRCHNLSHFRSICPYIFGVGSHLAHHITWKFWHVTTCVFFVGFPVVFCQFVHLFIRIANLCFHPFKHKTWLLSSYSCFLILYEKSKDVCPFELCSSVRMACRYFGTLNCRYCLCQRLSSAITALKLMLASRSSSSLMMSTLLLKSGDCWYLLME